MPPNDGGDRVEERILVLAPTGRDGELTSDILRRHGLLACACDTMTSLCNGIERGAAAAIIAEEALLRPQAIEALHGVLERQPPWSDLPIIVFSRHALGPRLTMAGMPRGGTV